MGGEPKEARGRANDEIPYMVYFYFNFLKLLLYIESLKKLTKFSQRDCGGYFGEDFQRRRGGPRRSAQLGRQLPPIAGSLKTKSPSNAGEIMVSFHSRLRRWGAGRRMLLL